MKESRLWNTENHAVYYPTDTVGSNKNEHMTFMPSFKGALFGAEPSAQKEKSAAKPSLMFPSMDMSAAALRQVSWK